MRGEFYSIGESVSEHVMDITFKLHNHDQYEILLFLEGDAKYVVEENSYTLEPCDIIIIRKHEMHRIYHNSDKRYHRFILMVDPEFFRKYQCQDYETQFLQISSGIGHKIAADAVRSTGLYDAFLRFKKYSENFTSDGDSPILTSLLIEILYLIHKTTIFSAADITANPMQSVILYLNNNYAEDITLDMLEERFFMSKYHLCRAFHKATGLTIHEYIRRKRLTRARELKAEGKNITEAAISSGFRDYSSFYRAYQKEYGCSPRSGASQPYNTFQSYDVSQPDKPLIPHQTAPRDSLSAPSVPDNSIVSDCGFCGLDH